MRGLYPLILTHPSCAPGLRHRMGLWLLPQNESFAVWFVFLVFIRFLRICALVFLTHSLLLFIHSRQSHPCHQRRDRR